LLGTTHILFAVFLFLVLWRGGFVGLDLLVFGAMVVGSVLPDLDHPRGLVYHFLGFPRWVRRGVTRLVGQRGVVHSLLAALIVLVLGLVVCFLVGLNFLVAFGLFGGFLSHLFLDSLTVRGVGWLLPFSKKRVRFVVGTGTMIERLFFFALVVFVVVLGFPLVSEVVEVFV
jgi:inner membrane protein